MKVAEGGADQDGLVHFRLCQLIAEPQAVGEPSGLHRVPCHVGLEGLHVPLPEDPVQPPVKIRVPLLYLKLIHIVSRLLFIDE